MEAESLRRWPPAAWGWAVGCGGWTTTPFSEAWASTPAPAQVTRSGAVFRQEYGSTYGIGRVRSYRSGVGPSVWKYRRWYWSTGLVQDHP